MKARSVRSNRLPTPGLDAWRKRGNVTRYDDLWRLSCWEAAALEAHRQGAPSAPDRIARCQEAAEVIVFGRTCRTCKRDLTVYEYREIFDTECRECSRERERREREKRNKAA